MFGGSFEVIAPSFMTIVIVIAMAFCIYGCCVWEGKITPLKQSSSSSAVNRHNYSSRQNEASTSNTACNNEPYANSDVDLEVNEDIYSAMEKLNSRRE
ncbi:hypothetical protein EB796_010002 [Bugula neritina]|uniref:Uncharacterized protein n=1 Tax=Bugula neritina TaxID=10212 RepID=A0A7J7K279_BUGNE|nr:hypothetical protein EB796_010002 [Bugula neritina]